MTQFVFRDDSYLSELETRVAEVTPEGGVILKETVFYAASGGQPGDTGTIEAAGAAIRIDNTVHPDGDKARIVHVPGPDSPRLEPGTVVRARIDWERRYRLMRMHTALHLLSVVFAFPVTGGSVGEDKGRLDFDMPEAPDNVPELAARLNRLAAGNHQVTAEWVTEEELAANPGLVKTMKVKPPTGQGRVRLIRIGDVDLQPCGGTHVRNTSEIGPLTIGRIEKKGAMNRRVNLSFG